MRSPGLAVAGLALLVFIGVACTKSQEPVKEGGTGGSGTGGTGGGSSGSGGSDCAPPRVYGFQYVACCNGAPCNGQCVGGHCDCLGAPGCANGMICCTLNGCQALPEAGQCPQGPP